MLQLKCYTFPSKSHKPSLARVTVNQTIPNVNFQQTKIPTAQSGSISGKVEFTTISGDLNGDFTVDIFDALILAGAFETTPGIPSWDIRADINKDGVVDIFDALVLAKNYGKSWT